ncbi:CHAT domain-containing protein [Actinoplanes sp. OR16]|uniref:CHAT domain-containing protein n=1 Tax=Actinoplanes sp. OR16 TaxID=946334 RepID=UPI000F6D724B|nr:CHAT domain-containing protein [Actinoplanes sp. OR16]BBH67871.1 CHAT domain-containing protein [Actinoplanes sp. OR16]
MPGTQDRDADVNAAAANLEREVGRILDDYGETPIPPAVLDRMIAALTHAAEVPGLDPEVAAHVWSTLGFVLKCRFLQDLTGDGGLTDIELCIDYYHRALAVVPPPGPYPIWGNLAQACLARCLKMPGDVAAAREAVLVHACALDVLTPADPEFASALSAAAFLLTTRFALQEGDLGLEDLAAAFFRARDKAAPGSPAASAAAMAHAETLLVLRMRGEPVPPKVELSAWWEVLSTQQPGDDRARNALYELGKELVERYRSGGSADDLDDAVQALALAADQPSTQADFAGMLAYALRLRAERDRPDPEDDLDAGVTAMRAALRASAPGEERDTATAQLGDLLLQRFRATRQRKDLDEAIERGHQVLDGKGLKIGEDDPGPQRTAVRMMIQALTLRADLDGNSADASIAGLLRWYNPDVSPNTNTEFGASIPAGAQRLVRPEGRLQRMFGRMYTVLAATRRAHTHPDHELAEEIDEQIRWLEQAVRSDIPGAERMRFRDDLTDTLSARHIAVPEPRLLDDMITHQTALLGELPEHEAVHRAAHRLGLAQSHYERYEASHRPDDFDAAVRHVRQIVPDPAVTTELRLWAAVALGEFGGRAGRWEIARVGFGQAVALLPRLVGRQLSPDDHLREMSRWSDLACDAAAAAVRSGDPGHALEVLEQGRGLLIGRALDSRAAFDEVLAADPRQAPALLDDLRRIGDALAVSETGHGGDAADSSDVDRRRALGKQWDRTVDRIRALPGCADFLAPVTVERLRPAAAGGPVVTIIVSRFGSAALVLTAGGVEAVPLPDLTPSAVRDHVARFHESVPFAELSPADADLTRFAQQPLRDVLAWLWRTIAEPVLAHLGEAPPRIWWITTGELGALPVHAAGLDGGSSMLDLTVSSYTPTVRSLLAASRRGEPAGAPRVQLVGMRETLPGVNAEVNRILEHLPHARHVFDADATRGRVRAALRDTGWLHVACHAISYATHPADSALHLYDGPLTVRELLADRAPYGRLAYLSACQTVLTSAAASAEVIHLGTALQAAGFQHVVGTLWSVTDGTAAETAHLFYQGVGGRPDASRSALALHDAVRELRRRYPGMPTRWAAYAHFGP